MKSLRNKVILSGIVLVFAFIATIGSTYAWFTVSLSNTVDSMELSVTAANNLMIMPYDDTADYINDSGAPVNGTGSQVNLAYASNYKTTVSNDDLYAAGYLYESISGTVGNWTLADPWRLQPVTAVDSDYNGIDGATLSSINLSNGVLTQTTSFNNNSGYAIELNFWLYSQSEDNYQITLTTPTITTDETGDLADVINAVRFSVWAGDAAAEFGPTTPTTAAIFGLDDDFGYVFPTGSVLAGQGLDETSTGTIDILTASAAVNVIGVDDPNVFPLNGQEPTFVTVLIFLEGWDQSTTNDITLATFSISFGFEFGDIIV